MDASYNVIAAVGNTIAYQIRRLISSGNNQLTRNWFERGEGGGGPVFIADRIWLFSTWNTISRIVTSVTDIYTWETMWFW